MDSDPNWWPAVVGGALALAAFFSATEAAWRALAPGVLLSWQESSRPLLRLLTVFHRHRALVALLSGLGATSALFVAQSVGAAWAGLSGFGYALIPLGVVALIGVPLLVLLPRQAAAGQPQRVVEQSVLPLVLLLLALAPLWLPLLALAWLALRAGGARWGQLSPPVGEDELKALVAESESGGALSEPQRQMLYGVLDFADQTVAQLMTPRPDMVSVPADRPLREALRVALEHHHRRLPLYRRNDDNIVGVWHVKDALPYVRDGDLEVPVRVTARPAYYVPETLPARALLAHLQQTRQSIAIVRDEFGGTAGLVTLEDLLEAIVGPIRDEDDRPEEPEVEWLGPEELVCDGLLPLHSLENLLQVELPEDDYDNVAGFLLDVAGRLPLQGEQFCWGAVCLTAERVRGHRLERVRLRRRTAGDALGGEG